MFERLSRRQLHAQRTDRANRRFEHHDFQELRPAALTSRSRWAAVSEQTPSGASSPPRLQEAA